MMRIAIGHQSRVGKDTFADFIADEFPHYQRVRIAQPLADIVKNIQEDPTLYGVDNCKYTCRAYFNKVCNDLRILNKFEDTLHANHGALKAHNYVYKIELIKIRNHVYHHTMYKFETRYF